MPEATILRENENIAASSGAREIAAQHLPLYLPSSISLRASCSPKICKFEFQLRYAQAHDALNDLRHHLRLRTHLWKFKTRFERGQRPNTRARNVIEWSTHKIEAAAAKYRAAREALAMLGPPLGMIGWETILRVLDAKDIRAMSEDERDMDPAARRKAERQSEGRRAVSWIWTTPGVSADDDDNLHDGAGSIYFQIFANIMKLCSPAHRVVQSKSACNAMA
jgi:hypothetical protein